jgi:RNA polymerase sigma-70 factor, ECF subfamily
MPQGRIIAPRRAPTQAGDVWVEAFDPAPLSRGVSFQEQRTADPLRSSPGRWHLRVTGEINARELRMGMPLFDGQDVEAPTGVPPPAAAMTPLSAREANTRFAEVVLPHLDDAYALARWLTGNRADAEDVVQDGSLRAFRGIAGFTGGNARAWVLTIVRHAAYVWMRKNRPSAILMVEDLEAVERQQTNFGTPDRETPETALIAKGESKRIEAAIAALPAPFRETVVLRDLQGLSYREIAAVTQVPVGTVMSRLARARGRLMQTVGSGEGLH